jgi:hypothetical protein
MRLNRQAILLRVMRRSWHLSKAVPSGQVSFIENRLHELPKWIFKYLKRRLFNLLVSRALGLAPELSQIADEHHSILWINWAAPSLGDSLMDLSARVLLNRRELVLLTHPKNKSLFENDHYFSSVFSDHRELISKYGKGYFDLVICDSYSPKVLIKKAMVAPFVPYVGLYGYLNGFEVHRTYFAFIRMMELLALNKIDDPIRPSISLDRRLVSQTPEVDVCIAVGGEWCFRTYNRWGDVVSWLTENGYSVSLVGSENGVYDASEILEKQSSVRSTVGRLSIQQVCVEISKAKVFIGADGGLWHIACAIPIPTVALFADCQIFDEEGNRVTRETQDMICEILYDEIQVSSIPSSRVIEAFDRLWNRIGFNS